MHLLITQHCFASYREPLFCAILRGEAGVDARLAFGTSPTAENLKAYRNVTEIPVWEGIQECQYRELKNVWVRRPFLWQRGVLQEINSGNFDAVVMEGCPFHLSTWVSLLLLRRRGIRCGLWSHGSRAPLRGVRKWCARAFFGLADFVLLYGQTGRRHLVNAGIKPNKLYPFHNSLDYSEQKKVQSRLVPDKVEGLRKKLFEDWQRPILLWVGRLNRQRRLDLLVSAAALLHRQGQPANLLFVGPDDGETQQSLQGQLGTEGITKYAAFYGACYDENVTAMFFDMASALVYPGPVGLGAIHALTYGMPVVTCNSWDEQKPEADAILPGITGEFFEAGDVESLGKAIVSILDMSEKDRMTMKAACDRVVATYYTPQYQCHVLNRALLGQAPEGWNWRDQIIHEYRTSGA